MDNKKIALLACEIASSKKAENPIVLEVKKLTPFIDYFVICSGNSRPQIVAIKEAIEEKLAQEQIFPRGREWKVASRWILLDYNGVVIHIFLKEARQFYNLERLWGKAKVIPFQERKLERKRKD